MLGALGGAANHRCLGKRRRPPRRRRRRRRAANRPPRPARDELASAARRKSARRAARALVFKLWSGHEGDERDALLRDVLLERGWIDGGDLGPRECYYRLNDPENYRLPEIVRNQDLGPPYNRTYAVPRRAFWVCGDDSECRQLRDLPGISTPQAEWHRISGFPGAEPACYKTSTAKCLRGFDFVPETYLVPQEAAALVAAAAAARAAARATGWGSRGTSTPAAAFRSSPAARSSSRTPPRRSTSAWSSGECRRAIPAQL